MAFSYTYYFIIRGKNNKKLHIGKIRRKYLQKHIAFSRLNENKGDTEEKNKRKVNYIKFEEFRIWYLCLICYQEILNLNLAGLKSPSADKIEYMIPSSILKVLMRHWY